MSTSAAPPLRVLVVDDEAPARDELAFLLGRIPEVASVAEAADASECLAALEADDVDALFLDVRMPRLDGLDLARVTRRMARPPLLVFVTAFERHAVDAFALAAVDYLLKPVRPQRLRQTVDRLLSMRAGASVPTDAMDDRLAVLSRGQIVLVAVDDVRVAEADGERVTVRTHDGVYTARHTLADLERHLAPRGFLRVHRAHLVNLRHVLTVEAFFNGTYLLRLRDLPDVTVPVARRHAAALRAAIHI